jgi:hypothetical protein
MTCEHEGKAFYERKKELFKVWYWKNKASEEFRERMRLKSKESYKKSKDNMKMLKSINEELEAQNKQLRDIIEDLKEIIDFDNSADHMEK